MSGPATAPQGATTNDWFCCRPELFQFHQNLLEESQKSAALDQLISFLETCLRGFVMDVFDGHPPTVPKYVVEVEYNVNSNENSQYKAVLLQFGEDLRSVTWYKLGEDSWENARPNFGRGVVRKSYCQRRGISTNYILWKRQDPAVSSNVKSHHMVIATEIPRSPSSGSRKLLGRKRPAEDDFVGSDEDVDYSTTRSQSGSQKRTAKGRVISIKLTDDIAFKSLSVHSGILTLEI